MSGLGISRGAAGAALAAALMMSPALLAPQAAAAADPPRDTATIDIAAEPIMSISTAGSALSIAHTGAVGCRQTAQAALRNPDGSPVSQGTVDFFSHLSGMSGNLVGTVPVSNGIASIPWIPDQPGEHVISAIYYDGGVQPIAGYTMITVLPVPGPCV